MDQRPELGSPTSEAQAWYPAGAPRPCQPHGIILFLCLLSFASLSHNILWNPELYYHNPTSLCSSGTHCSSQTSLFLRSLLSGWCTGSLYFFQLGPLSASFSFQPVLMPFSSPAEAFFFSFVLSLVLLAQGYWVQRPGTRHFRTEFLVPGYKSFIWHVCKKLPSVYVLPFHFLISSTRKSFKFWCLIQQLFFFYGSCSYIS